MVFKAQGGHGPNRQKAQSGVGQHMQNFVDTDHRRGVNQRRKSGLNK